MSSRTPRQHEPAYAGRVDADAVTDAQLVGYLDGEFSPAAGASLREILAERDELAARLAQLERRSVRLSALLREVSPGETQVQQSAAVMRPQVMASATQAAQRRLPTGMKAAAALALLFGLALFVPDARAWMLDRIRDIGAAIGIGTPEPVPAPHVTTPPVEPAPAAVAITFAIARDTLDVSARSLAGVLVVRRGAGATASAEASGADARFTVVPGGLQIDGPASADAVYTLTVPAQVTAVRLERARDDVAVHRVTATGPELRIPLTRR